MIEKYQLRLLRNAEYIQFIRDVLACVLTHDPEALQLTDAYNELMRFYNTLTVMCGIPKGSSYTAELIATDKLRDNAVKGIVSLIRAQSFREDKIISAQAKLLQKRMKSLGTDVVSDNFISETTVIRKLLFLFEEDPVLSPAAQAIGMEPWLVSLKAANTNFETKYRERAVVKGSEPPRNIKKLRPFCNQAYYSLRNRIDSFNGINKNIGPHVALQNNINGLIKWL